MIYFNTGINGIQGIFVYSYSQKGDIPHQITKCPDSKYLDPGY